MQLITIRCLSQGYIILPLPVTGISNQGSCGQGDQDIHLEYL